MTDDRFLRRNEEILSENRHTLLAGNIILFGVVLPITVFEVYRLIATDSALQRALTAVVFILLVYSSLRLRKSLRRLSVETIALREATDHLRQEDR